MFGYLYELMAGGHGELPRRRSAPSVDYDRAAGGFVTADGAEIGDEEWLGRGEIPGQRARELALREAAAAREGLSLADEMRELAQTPRR